MSGAVNKFKKLRFSNFVNDTKTNFVLIMHQDESNHNGLPVLHKICARGDLRRNTPHYSTPMVSMAVECTLPRAPKYRNFIDFG